MLATRLLSNGINVVLDQWDCRLGQDIALFMEQGLATAHRVLVVCTETYVAKANSGKGGVGYERMILSAELVKNLGSRKFIPIVRNVAGQDKIPRCLGTRRYADFSDGHDCAEDFEELVRDIHNLPPPRPARGTNPFSESACGSVRTSVGDAGARLQMIYEAIIRLTIWVQEDTTTDLLPLIQSAIVSKTSASNEGLAQLKPANLTSGPRQLTARVSGNNLILSAFPFFIRCDDDKPFRSISLDFGANDTDVTSYEYRPSGNLSKVSLTVLAMPKTPMSIALREQKIDPQTLIVAFDRKV